MINESRHDKTNKMSVRLAKPRISLGIRPVWSESSLRAQWVAKDPSFLHADSEDWSDWADAVGFVMSDWAVGFVMSRFKFLESPFCVTSNHVMFSGTATLSVTVVDVNDNTPEFGNTGYIIYCDQWDAPGTKIGDLSAQDDGKVWYNDE